MTDPIPPVSTQIPPPPAWARGLSVLLGCVLALSSLGVLFVTLFAGDAVLWFSTLFEALVLVSGVVACLAGLGRYREGWGMALLCVAGTVLVSAVFAGVEIRANFRDHPDLGGLIKPAIAIRLAFAVGFAAIASLAVWSRDPRSWSLAIKGVLCTLPVLGVAAWIASGRAGLITAAQPTPTGEAVRIIALLAGGLVGIILVSAGGHLLIRAYEVGRPDAGPSARSGTGKAA